MSATAAPAFTPLDVALASLAVANDALDERYRPGDCPAVDEARESLRLCRHALVHPEKLAAVGAPFAPPAPAAPPFVPDEEQVSWLGCLIADYELHHDPDRDDDPQATAEMLGECRRLRDQLRALLPPRPEARAVEADSSLPL